jgi:16S rRNA (cytidine1402-2'-O)-methyltransferase
VASYDHPVVFFEAPHRIARTLEELGALTGPARPVAVCREMTKLHEQLIRGPIAEVAAHADVLQPQGEFTVVLLPADEPVVDAAVTDEAVWREFCSLTENEGLRRREAVTLAARRLGVATREAYAALERHKAVRALAHQS